MPFVSIPETKPLNIAITGAGGLIGKHLASALAQSGHTVFCLQRTPASGPATWNVQTGEITTPSPADALIHLAGRSVASRWTTKVKAEIQNSRGPATERLSRHLALLPPERRPRFFISTSAVGIYGNRGDEVLTEESTPAPRGTSFLADVCLDWEAATKPAEDSGIAVVHPRIGVVLSRDGGALAKLLTPAKLFLGGPLGRGAQFLPWISITDLTRLFLALLADPSPPRILNAVGPAPTRQLEFMRTLGKVIHRPAIVPLPAFMLKLAMGQMAEEMLLASTRAIPTKLPARFTFEHPTLESALRAALPAATPESPTPRVKNPPSTTIVCPLV